MGYSEFEEAWHSEMGGERALREAHQLGEVLLREVCSALAVPEAITVRPADSIRRAIQVMVDCRVGCVLVVEGSRVIGIFTERDVMTRIVAKQIAHDRPVTDVMTRDPMVLGPGDPVVLLLNRMVDGGYRHIPIVDAEGRPLGVASVRTFVEWIVSHVRREVLNLPPRSRESQLPTIDGG
jgi:CBS domain-containing protein